jgi:formylglycine-generating enzyme required for sulfatase activity
VRRIFVVPCLVAAACGRIGFASRGGSDGGDGSITDVQDGPGTLADGAAQSCVGLAASCGPMGTASCCASVLVPGGTYSRSYDVAVDAMFPDMTNTATLSDFHLDTYEVTVGRFRQFVNAGMGTQQNPPPPDAGARPLGGVADQGGWNATWNAGLPADTAALTAALLCNTQWQTWTAAPGANENLALNCLSWFDAFAFCVWDGGFLPTEAQWNYAAAGGADQRAYPWSNPASSVTIDCTYANFDPMPECLNKPNGAVAPVGSDSPTGDAKWGNADLAGNLEEWTLDWANATYPNPCNDCADLAAGSTRAVRGGDFRFFAPNLRTAKRYGVTPSGGGPEIGFRCAH